MSGRSLCFATVFVVASSAALVSCSGVRDDDPAARTQPQTPVATPEPLPEAPPPVPPAPDLEDERRTNDALAVAADSAEAADRGTDDCESAHNQLIAMLGTVAEELGREVHRPERAAFLEVCREMPPAARRCIVPTTAMENQTECGAALESLPEDLTQRLHAVINGPGAD